MAHLSTARNIISSCQISSHLIKIIATFIVIINSVIFTGAIAILHLIRASLASRVGFLDQIKCEPSRLRNSLVVYPRSNHHIHCFNTTDILFTCLDILSRSCGTKIAHLVISSIVTSNERGALLRFSVWSFSVETLEIKMKYLDEKNEKRNMISGRLNWGVDTRYVIKLPFILGYN